MTESKIPMVKVQDLFPADNPNRVTLARFLIACQSLTALERALSTLPANSGGRESKVYFLTLSIGVTNEAAAVFMEADAKGAFAETASHFGGELEGRLLRLRKECDAKNSDSLRKTLVLQGRNTVAFHWDPKVIGRTLKRLENSEIPGWAGGEDETISSVAFPLVERVVLDALENLVGSPNGLDDLVQRLTCLQGDLIFLAHCTYTYALKNATGVSAT